MADNMTDIYEELDISEDELMVNHPEIVIRKGNLVGKIVALILGLIIGFGACLGTILALLNFTSVGYGMDMLSGFTGVDFDKAVNEKLISEEYGEKSVLQLISDAAVAANSETLEDLNKIFPILGEYVGSMTDNAKDEFGVELDKDTMLKTPLNDLTTYIGDTVKHTSIGAMLSASNTSGNLDPMLMEICYGEENVNYYFDEDGEVQMLENSEPLTIFSLSNEPGKAFERVSVASVVDPSLDDSLMMSIAYGQEGVTYNIVKVDGVDTVEMCQLFLTKNESGNFVDYAGNLVLCKQTPLSSGYIKIEEYRKDANDKVITNKDGEPIVKRVYYVKNDGTGTYYAYESAEEDAEETTFKKTLISDLQDNSAERIDNIPLKNALGIEFKAGQEDPHNILISLAYGQEGIDYEIVGTGDNRKIEMLGDSKPRTIGELRTSGNDLINDILLSDIMQEKRDDNITMYLLYGKKGIHYEFEPKLDELGNPILDELGNPVTEVAMQHRFIYILGNQVYNEYGEALQERTETVKGYILNTETSTWTDRLDNVYTYGAASTETYEMNDGALAYKHYLSNEDGDVLFQKTTLGDMARSDNPVANITNRLTVSEIIGEEAINGNKILKHLGDEKIQGLPKAIEKLTFWQVFEEDMYLRDTDGNYVDQNGNVVTEENRVIDGMWKFMLTPAGATEINKDYTLVDDMNQLLTNAEDNVNNASLQELKSEGILVLDDTTLGTPLKSSIGGATIDTFGKSTIGELTTNEMMQYLSAVLYAIP